MSRHLPSALGDLAFEIDAATFEPLGTPDGPMRPVGTGIVVLAGGGLEGRGEDVAPYVGEDFDEYSAPPADLLPTLVGSWTLQSFTDHLFGASLWDGEVAWELQVNFRRWSFQSAALDLALQVAGTTLPEVLDRPARPLTFINSMGLGDEPSFDEVRTRLAAYPGLRFKLDASPKWSTGLMDELAATGAVDVVDFKGQYGIPVEDEDALVTMYRRAVERFPDAVLEDPHEIDAVTELLTPHAGRVSYDAPIRTVDDLGVTTIPMGAVNVKPCRVGDLAELLAIYEQCERQGLPIYSGGMGELDVGRGQAQLLSAMFHADAANDIAPSGYNEKPVPAGLPSSPLRPGRTVGFRW